jgi:hypothetical protein
MTAVSEDIRYTAASSLVSNPTSRFGSFEDWRESRASDRTVGPILAAQPHVRASPVNVFFLKKIIFDKSLLYKSQLS